MADGFEIVVCPQVDLRVALSLVLRTLPADQRGPLVESLARLRDEPLGAFQALVVARKGGMVHAAAWGQPQPGKSCSLWTPQSENAKTGARLSEALIAKIVRIADSVGVDVTQTLAENARGEMHVPLTRNGFQQLAELRYLEWKAATSIPTVPADDEVVFEPFGQGVQRRLESIIGKTYQQTLDFPELDGMRNLRDVINGYRCVGEFDPELWYFIRHQDQDAGVLLLAEYPDTHQIELVYVGIDPQMRGLGLGAAAVRFGQNVVIERGRQRMVLAVDARNTPAQEIYHQAGFKGWAKRFAYLRPRAAG